MKKLSSLILVLAMVLSLFTLVSCGSTPVQGKDAQAALDFINEKMEAVKSYKVEMNMNMGIIQIPMTMYAVKSGDSFNTKAVSEYSLMGMTLKQTVVTIGEDVYTLIDTDGEVQKVKTKQEEDTSTNDAIMADGFLNPEFVKQDEAKDEYVIKATLSDKYKDTMEDQEGTSDTFSGTVEITCGKDGLIRKIVMETESIKIEMTISQIDAVTEKVEVPSDASSYLEVPEV